LCGTYPFKDAARDIIQRLVGEPAAVSILTIAVFVVVLAGEVSVHVDTVAPLRADAVEEVLAELELSPHLGHGAFVWVLAVVPLAAGALVPVATHGCPLHAPAPLTAKLTATQAALLPLLMVALVFLAPTVPTLLWLVEDLLLGKSNTLLCWWLYFTLKPYVECVKRNSVLSLHYST
jgi:hypothetical protein